MIASGAELESTIESAALFIEGFEAGIRCAISVINPDGLTFSKVFAPGLPPFCKVRLLQTPVGPPMLNPNRNDAKNYPASLLGRTCRRRGWEGCRLGQGPHRRGSLELPFHPHPQFQTAAGGGSFFVRR